MTGVGFHRGRDVPLRAANDHLSAGFTLIELLVAITIIALLLALTLPAVHSARVAARNTQCRNHLRQLGVAMADHEATHQRYPANGWGYRWVGEPDRGTDERQPGGWIYNLLDHLEQSPLRRTGSGLAPRAKEGALSELMATPLEVFRCPSRPGRDLMLANIDVVPFNANWVPLVAKTDYAVNEGDVITDTRAGPRTLEEGDSGRYQWRDPKLATGVCFQRSRIRPQDVRDGLSNTYMIGEKYVSSEHYFIDGDLGHDQSMYTGVDLDINRWTIKPPLRDAEASSMELARRFGSAHQGGCNFLMCDGSVHQVSYNVDAETHRRLGNRHDGEVVQSPW